MWWVVLALVAIAAASREATAAAYTLKPGVYGVIRSEMAPAVEAVRDVWAWYGLGLPVITSIEDGRHSAGSLHPAGLALDYRLNTIDPVLHAALRAAVALKVGTNFDVLHERHGSSEDHLHIEFDPK